MSYFKFIYGFCCQVVNWIRLAVWDTISKPDGFPQETGPAEMSVYKQACPDSSVIPLQDIMEMNSNNECHFQSRPITRNNGVFFQTCILLLFYSLNTMMGWILHNCCPIAKSIFLLSVKQKEKVGDQRCFPLTMCIE